MLNCTTISGNIPSLSIGPNAWINSNPVKAKLPNMIGIYGVTWKHEGRKTPHTTLVPKELRFWKGCGQSFIIDFKELKTL